MSRLLSSELVAQFRPQAAFLGGNYFLLDVPCGRRLVQSCQENQIALVWFEGVELGLTNASFDLHPGESKKFRSPRMDFIANWSRRVDESWTDFVGRSAAEALKLFDQAAMQPAILFEIGLLDCAETWREAHALTGSS